MLRWYQEMISFLKAYRKILILALGFLILAVSILSLNTSLLFPSLQFNRKVLSSLIYSPDDQVDRYQILKVKNNDKIIVEIYKIISEYDSQFVSRIDTGSKYEGYFLLGGNATNLAYINIDDDPAKEIIVPGFDSNLIAHLNVIKFDNTSKSFTLINQKILPLPSENL
jgi:hypothetical protein